MKKKVEKTTPVEEFRSSMRTPPEGMVTLGIAKGVTVNIGNYNSARADVFIVKNVKETDFDREYNKLSEIIDNRLTQEVEELTKE